ncbi:hypothetical protein [Promicromonospora soli]
MMHEYCGGNLALRRVVAEVNSARPNAPVVDGPPARRRRTAGRRTAGLRTAGRRPSARVALAGALRGVAARLDPPCPTPQGVARQAMQVRGGAV